SEAIANKLRMLVAQHVHEAQVAVFGPPPVRGVGRAGGFALMIEDRGAVGPAFLQEQTEKLGRKGSMLGKDERHPMGMFAMFSVFRANVPQLHIDPDPGACMMRGVSLRDFASTVSVYEGSLYVNDFNRFGRTWQVIVQAESGWRERPDSLAQLKVRNVRG